MAYPRRMVSAVKAQKASKAPARNVPAPSRRHPKKVAAVPVPATRKSKRDRQREALGLFLKELEEKLGPPDEQVMAEVKALWESI